jgi:hypothetical protein
MVWDELAFLQSVDRRCPPGRIALLCNRNQSTQTRVAGLRLARAVVPKQGFGIHGIRPPIQRGARHS